VSNARRVRPAGIFFFAFLKKFDKLARILGTPCRFRTIQQTERRGTTD
jgi:hypothetical protein